MDRAVRSAYLSTHKNTLKWVLAAVMKTRLLFQKKNNYNENKMVARHLKIHLYHHRRRSTPNGYNSFR